ncbi:MAG: hypothetical protein CMM30_02925 [Rhodospirillaceae bacterium]|nr:hypothetical protein [Alphaproteobacteria bacterium]MBR71879.1 hypothetical protein [Rhodospirillaceae bacterium]|tara:strand:- start:419 stop:1555 length:1137 start_codon:yes stop_codon:yes gene_type:complete
MVHQNRARADRIPLAVPDLRGNELVYLKKCIETNWVSSAGPFIGECEEIIKNKLERSNAIATVNGSAALHLSLLACKTKPGDYVIIPDWTFAATANAVYHAGCIPIFADIDKQSYSLDPDIVEKIISNYPGRISAMIVVHPLGHPANLDPLISISKSAKIPLIEDAAGAFGAKYQGRPVGSFGEFSVLSFNGNKTITAGGGGMILTNSSIDAAYLRKLSGQARVGQDYKYESIGFNYRMTNINAGLLLAQLERMDEMLAAKRKIAEIYDPIVNKHKNLKTLSSMNWGESSNWLYSVVCESEPASCDLMRYLDAQNIEVRSFWRSLSIQPPYIDAPSFLNGVSEKLTGKVVSFPCSSSLTDDDQARVISHLSQWNWSSG